MAAFRERVLQTGSWWVVASDVTLSRLRDTGEIIANIRIEHFEHLTRDPGDPAFITA